MKSEKKKEKEKKKKNRVQFLVIVKFREPNQVCCTGKPQVKTLVARVVPTLYTVVSIVQKQQYLPRYHCPRTMYACLAFVSRAPWYLDLA